ncbi:TPA: linear amide C-N hydrolase [Escherichia coli]|nr:MULTISPECIES: linear amide C-N hydrolase [Enterobacteriaceae]ELB5802458.1 linear amide C-N hydrolase [Salmonella enterica]MDU1380442.1 linear amide C-N hydrolase [Klebsiella michiganensis]HDT3215830.1 linear amide C-N hydrolase [Klebsiella pneumoniae subsp. pneumoniae]EIA1384122.1 linear amide C-N hydrolase [Escherichia coli]EKZ9732263.1 linear amide C-N hydrolase [Klebsiella pneumoniae]
MMCTRVMWPDANGAVIVGRNMDFHKDLKTNLWMQPRGIARDDGVNGNLKWTSRYGSVVATAFDMMSVDGMNEAGLAGHVLWLVESDYGEPDASRTQLSQAAWLQYFLDNFSSVAESVEWIEKSGVQVVQMEDPTGGNPPAIHLALDDANGDSCIIEYSGGQAVVYHSPEYRVMTNSPTYDKQLAQVRTFSGLGGEQPLPGSTLASDRFARASYYVSRLNQPATQIEAIAAMFSVMRNAAQPFRVPDPGKPEASQTLWQVVMDLTHRRYVFESTTRPNIVWVNFDELDFSTTSPQAKLNLVDDLTLENGIAGNVSRHFKQGETLTLLTMAMLKHAH